MASAEEQDIYTQNSEEECARTLLVHVLTCFTILASPIKVCLFTIEEEIKGQRSERQGPSQ